MRNEPKFKIGDFVFHDRFGVGEVKEIGTKVYRIAFDGIGERKVRLTTYMRPRKNGDYIVHVEKRCFELSICLWSGSKENQVELKEDFTVERFNELVSLKSFEYSGVRYKLFWYSLYAIPEHVLTYEHTKEMFIREAYGAAHFEFYIPDMIEKELKEGLNPEEVGRCIGGEKDMDEYAYIIWDKYGKNIVIK